MIDRPADEDPIEAVALLQEPTRRGLYELVAASHEPVSRDDAAAARGISRELAAFHLDRLAAAGLLAVEYRRLGGRTGPGAGRPAKLYRRAEREVTVSLPSRHYERAAEVMATALDRLEDGSGAAAATAIARERGIAAGLGARRETGSRPGRGRLLAKLVDLLRSSGYAPETDVADGTVCLRNCPYQSLVADHRDLTCGMNLAWAEGVVAGLGAPVGVELAPTPSRCCVVFHADTVRPGRPADTAPEP